ncbi:MAG TPA: ABC transporter substrate-binding protein, partial [Acidobacteriota bacterium]|nr:ABC transporter substrate-binding protein [Acidobacteriota bacterium]
MILSLGLLWAGILPAAEPLERVTLQLKWRHQFQFAGYYAAIERGFYREAGLEVELREAVPGRDPVESVLRGEADF